MDPLLMLSPSLPRLPSPSVAFSGLPSVSQVLQTYYLKQPNS